MNAAETDKDRLAKLPVSKNRSPTAKSCAGRLTTSRSN
jgi:hypothetical protein